MGGISLARLRGAEVDVPCPIDEVDLRCPDITGPGSVFRGLPYCRLLGLRMSKVFEALRCPQLDAVATGEGKVELIIGRNDPGVWRIAVADGPIRHIVNARLSDYSRLEGWKKLPMLKHDDDGIVMPR